MPSDQNTPATDPSDTELLAYLDETLSVQRSTQVEQMLRERSELRQRVSLLARWRDQGGHSLGEIWRRHRLSCPDRSVLGRYVLNIAPPALKEYIDFHLNEVECRFCRANVEDLTAALQPVPSEKNSRQKRYFESSAGLLRSRRPD